MNNQNVVLTQEGLDALKREYRQLVDQKRPDAVKRMAAAREQGDLAENSEYAAAREDLSFIDGRIAELEEILQKAKVVAIKHTKNLVDIGGHVTINVKGKNDVYTIVGEWEANPKDKKISHSSPLGKALMGKKVGETVEVEAPAGKVLYKIMHIE
ncbi:MAG: transcription elongation factor GreA [Patescibacteria group bacterium]